MKSLTKMFAAALFALLAGCSSSETYLTYGQPAGADDDQGGEAAGVCWLVGPHEVVHLVQLVKSQRFPRQSQDCSVKEPYVESYLELELRVLQSSNGKAPEIINAIGFYFSEGILAWAPGEAALVSIRTSEGTPFVMSYVPVTAVSETQPADGSAAYDLPSSWSELQAEVVATEANHAAECTEAWELGPSRSKQMSDDEFATWIRTPVPKPCDDPTPPPEPTDSGDGSDL